MLLSLSILPIFLLLIIIHSATSVDLYKNKRVPRRNNEFTRTYSLNHPPSVDNTDFIPVTVVYDDQDVIKVINEGAKKTDAVIVNEENNLRNVNASIKEISLLSRSVNPAPSHAIIDDEDDNDEGEKMLFGPKARSFDIKASKTGSNDNESDELKTLALKQRSLRRRSQVRRVKVNTIQIDAYLNETKKSDNKTASKIGNYDTVDTLQHPKTFKRRKQLRDPVVPIIESESYVFAHSGDFHYSYEGGDGTKAFERGELKNANGGAGSAVEGSFSYKDKEGNDYSLTYTADENGYRPVGAHLPTPPPIPPAIQRALDLLATKKEDPITEKYRYKF